MELIRGIHNIRARHHGCVLTIGNFDGVHRGHQALIKQLKLEGQRLQAPVMVMIFEPQPLELFSASNAPARLTNLRDKVKYLSECGVDYLLCVKFDLCFAAYSARAFVAQLLVKKLSIKFLTVGDDFLFGASRLGNFSLLQKAGAEYGFNVVNTQTFRQSGQRISSTAIRDALRNDRLDLAEDLLGHRFAITGRVVHGDKIGRTIGFPTANVPLKRMVSPVKGVYAVEVLALGPEPLLGVANIGTRPTVNGVRQQLEMHLFDTTLNLYARHIDVVLRAKLRNEQRFSSLDALKQQIASDQQTARDFFALKNTISD